VIKGSIAANTTGFAEADCPSGQVAIGGGGDDFGDSNADIYQDGPVPAALTSGSKPTGWRTFWKTGSTAITTYEYVLCAPGS